MFSARKLSKSTEFYQLESGLYLSITDIVDAMNTLIQEGHNLNEICITIKMSRGTRKPEVYLANDSNGLASLSTDLGHIFGSNVGIEFAVISRRKESHKPGFVFSIVGILSLKTYTDQIEYKNVVNSKTPLLRCFPFTSTLKAGDIKTTGQYMNYQTSANIQIRPLQSDSCFCIHIDLGDTTGQKTPCICMYHASCFNV